MKRNKYSEIIEFLSIYEKINNKEERVKFKERMREIRVEKGLKYSHFEETGLLSIGVVTQMEKVSNPYKPSLESLIKYCHILDIELIELIKDNN